MAVDKHIVGLIELQRRYKLKLKKKKKKKSSKENTLFQIKSYLNLFKTFIHFVFTRRMHFVCVCVYLWILFSFISFVTIFTTDSHNELNTFHFLAHFPSHFDLINCIEICALILCIYFIHFGWVVVYLFKLNSLYRTSHSFESVFIDKIE